MKRRPSPRAHKRLVSCEPLEERRMFVTYQVTGTSGPDSISIGISGNQIISVVNGVSDSASDLINNNIEINALGGNDTITIVQTGENTVTVNAGSGADTINLALGANDMDAIDDFVTVNGDADSDTVTINDQSETSTVVYTVLASNSFERSLVPAITTNVEDVVIRSPSGAIGKLVIDAVPTPDVRFVGSATTNNNVLMTGNGTETVNYRPDDFTNGEGDITFNSADINFENCVVVNANNVLNATLTTPNVTDVLTVVKNADFTIDGTSSGVAMAAFHVTNATNVAIDMATNDASGGNDTLTATGNSTFAGVLRINAGTGNNSLDVLSGAWSMTTAGGVGGANLDIWIDVASVAFQGAQSIRLLELTNGGVASFTGTTGSNAVQQVVLSDGQGTISTGTNNPLTISSSLSIDGDATLTKTGGGLLHVNAPQTHIAGAQFVARGGTTHFDTDCGGASALRTLGLFADLGDISLNATQHVKSLSTNFGDVHVGVNGNRVVVTESVSIGGEGGAINLNDNDLILDYTTVSAANELRALLHTGRANGLWNGAGVNSNSAAINPQHNTTLGSMEATEFKSVYGASAKFDNETIDNTCVLIKYTYYGDADFNGIVNFDDYSRTDSGFIEHRGGWLNGDFDDSGAINFDDYGLIDLGFNTQGSALLHAPLSPRPGFLR